MFIADFAIKRPLLTVVAMVALVIFGAFALLKLKTDEFPDVSPPWLTVGVIYPGASHMAHVEDTEGYVRLLDEFLSRVEQRVPASAQQP